MKNKLGFNYSIPIFIIHYSFAYRKNIASKLRFSISDLLFYVLLYNNLITLIRFVKIERERNKVS